MREGGSERALPWAASCFELVYHHMSTLCYIGQFAVSMLIDHCISDNIFHVLFANCVNCFLEKLLSELIPKSSLFTIIFQDNLTATHT